MSKKRKLPTPKQVKEAANLIADFYDTLHTRGVSFEVNEKMTRTFGSWISSIIVKGK